MGRKFLKRGLVRKIVSIAIVLFVFTGFHPASAALIDNFNRTNNADIGNSWEQPSGARDIWSVNGNTLRAQPSGSWTDTIIFRPASEVLTDTEASVDINSTDLGNYPKIVLRASFNSASTGYVFYISNQGDGSGVLRMINSAWSYVGNGTPALVNNHNYRLIGSARTNGAQVDLVMRILDLENNNNEIFNQTWHDTNASRITSSGRQGVSGYGAGTISFDNFCVTDLTVPPTISAVASSVTSATANITWNTDEFSTSTVEYGLTSAYGLSVSSGGFVFPSHSVLLNNLTANTTYHYRITSENTAGNATVSGDYTFLTAPEESWWNAAWSHRVKIVINTAQVPSMQNNFPVYINLANLSASFFSNVKSDGSDIRVTNSSGVELAREVAAINTGASTGELWFKADSISSGSYYYIYYGNPGASEPSPSAANGSRLVWDSDYVAVYHFSENTASKVVNDSTANGLNGLSQNNTSTMHGTGKVGSGFNFNGTTDYISITNPGTVLDGQSMGLEVWATPLSNDSYPRIFDRGYGSQFGFYINNSASAFGGYINTVDGYFEDTNKGSITFGDTVHLALTYDKATVLWYKNSLTTGSAALVSGGMAVSSEDIIIGNRGGSGKDREYRGMIDEVRISKIARSADWLRTEYNNQTSPSAFYSATNQYTFSYTASAHGSLTGSSSQIVNHGANGVAVTAVADANYHFVNWSDNSTQNPRTDTNATGNISVSANFAIDTRTLSYTAGANGSVTGTNPQTVAYGADGSAVTAVPDAGYRFIDWSDASTANPRTDTNITSNLSVTANFTFARAKKIDTTPVVVTPSISIGVPVALANYKSGSTVGVSWTSVNGAFVKYKIYYSADNGTTWMMINETSSTSFSWTVPDIGTTQGKIKVEGYDANDTLLASATLNSGFVIISETKLESNEPSVKPSEPAIDSTVTGTYSPSEALVNNPDINTNLNLPIAVSPSCVSGTLIKASLPAIYYCGADGKRYVFTSDRVFFSWYENFNGVKTLSDANLAAIPLGGNVTYRPGKKMVKIQSDPKVYVIARGGILRWVSTEAKARELFGENWNQQIDDVSDAFFVNYTLGEQL